ncbi:MAG: hypothetical protein LUH63_06410 [Parabacteroides sp.]|nr:hypothetical protein [Parabacteroides sp.]
MGTSEAVSEIGQKIEGSGPVVFDYKPLSKNTASTDLASGGALSAEKK